MKTQLLILSLTGALIASIDPAGAQAPDTFSASNLQEVKHAVRIDRWEPAGPDEYGSVVPGMVVSWYAATGMEWPEVPVDKVVLPDYMKYELLGSHTNKLELMKEAEFNNRQRFRQQPGI